MVIIGSYLKASEKEGDWYEVNDTNTFKLTRSDNDIINLSKIIEKIQNYNIYLLIFKRVTIKIVPYTNRFTKSSKLLLV